MTQKWYKIFLLDFFPLGIFFLGVAVCKGARWSIDLPPPRPGGRADSLDHVNDLAEPGALEGRRCDVCGTGLELNGAGGPET